MIEQYAPMPDFCWNGRLCIAVVLCCCLYITTYCRYRALQGCYFPSWTPRGTACGSILTAVLLCTAYTCVSIWNYTRWYSVRDLYNEYSKHPDDLSLLEDLASQMPGRRKQTSFGLRMMLVTILWMVKMSFILIFYDFREQLPKTTRRGLYIVTGTIPVTWTCIWVAAVADLASTLQEKKSTPYDNIYTRFTPLATWSNYIPSSGSSGPSTLVIAEVVITVLNVLTDLALLAIIFLIFRHLSLARRNVQYKAVGLMAILFSISISIAIIRFGLLLGGMESLSHRMTFDTITEIEAYISGMAASMPAIRVALRTRRDAAKEKAALAFNEIQSTTISSTSGGVQKIKSEDWRSDEEEALNAPPTTGNTMSDSQIAEQNKTWGALNSKNIKVQQEVVVSFDSPRSSRCCKEPEMPWEKPCH